MKKRIFFGGVLLCFSLYVLAQFTPPAIGAYISDGAGGWAAATSIATGGAINFTPPAQALYCYNTSLSKWVPADSSCFGGGGGGGTVGSGTAGQIAYYPATGTAVAGNPHLSDGGVSANIFTVLSTGGLQVGNSSGNLLGLFSDGTYNQIQTGGPLIVETFGSTVPIYIRPNSQFSAVYFQSGGTHFGTDSFSAADPGADNVAIKGNLLIGATTVFPTVRGSGTFTTATSDAFTVTGATASSNCTFTPTNTTAAAATVIAFISSVTTNSVTISHVATTASGGTVNIHCTIS